MKRMIIFLTVIVVGACHRQMEPWPSDSDKQNVAMYVRTPNLLGITASPAVYQVFIYDPQSQETIRYQVNPDQTSNQLQLKLFPGSYQGFCITHAEADEFWEFSENSTPEAIFLKSQKTKNGGETAGDHLLGQTQVEVVEGGENKAIFELNRKVGMLRVIIENVPEWLNDLQINLANLPTKMSLSGKYSTEKYTVSTPISLPDQNGLSSTDLLVFPPQDKSLLTLSSASQNFITSEHPIEQISANQITEIKAIFRVPSGSTEVNFTTNLIDWEEQIQHEDDWPIDIPEGPCQGEGNGNNLVANPGFEETWADNLPASWKLNASGSDKRIVEVTNPVAEGQKAIRLEGKTYLYQDIPVNGGQCYQLKMYVNAPTSNVKWRYWCTWMNGSTDIKMGELHPTNYNYQTAGYIDAFDGLVVRAPSNATKLRLEIRNYMTLQLDEGLYVDKVSVEKID